MIEKIIPNIIRIIKLQELYGNEKTIPPDIDSFHSPSRER